jgi:predicted nuclease with TOPRIM domain
MSQHLEIRDLKQKLSESQKQLGHMLYENEELKRKLVLSEYFVEANDLDKTIKKLSKENQKLEAQLIERNRALRDVIAERDKLKAQLELVAEWYAEKKELKKQDTSLILQNKGE